SLSWTAATGASTYNIYQGTSAGAESATAVQTAVSGTSATMTGLTNGTTYYFTVAAVAGGATSAASGEANAQPAASASSRGWGGSGGSWGGGGSTPGHGGGAIDPILVAVLALLAIQGSYRRRRKAFV